MNQEFKKFGFNGLQVTPLIGGIAVAAAAYAGRYSIQAWQAFKARPPTARLRKFYEGGFQSTMTRREAAFILGVRESMATDTTREAHRRVMIANHPDAGVAITLHLKSMKLKIFFLEEQRAPALHFDGVDLPEYSNVHCL